MELECSALHSTVREYVYKPKLHKYDVETFLYNEAKSKVVKLLKKIVGRTTQAKIQLSLQLQISRLREDEQSITITPWFHSTTISVTNSPFIKVTLDEPIKEILTSWDKFIHLGMAKYDFLIIMIYSLYLVKCNVCYCFTLHMLLFLFIFQDLDGQLIELSS